VKIFGLRQLERFIDKMERYPVAFQEAQAGVVQETVQYGRGVLTEAASGAPGPEVRSGAYLASLYTEVQGDPGTKFTISMGSDAPQSRRLEHGFYGADSLGRVYHQAPRPHIEPAMALTQAHLKQQLRGLPRRVWKSL
jgi:hypothetical protein